MKRCIESVLNQTYPDIEYIIIDGGSTDGTIDIIKKYVDKIAYWISEQDDGLYDAMNKGIRIASGDYINFMNAGDIFTSSDVVESIFSNELEDADISKKNMKDIKKSNVVVGQVDLFNMKGTAIANELEKLDLNGVTPIDALNILYKLKEKL